MGDSLLAREGNKLQPQEPLQLLLHLRGLGESCWEPLQLFLLNSRG